MKNQRSVLFGLFLLSIFFFNQPYLRAQAGKITTSEIQSAEKVVGLQFSSSERDSMLPDLQSNLDSYRELRKIHLDNSVPPAILFNPLPPGFQVEQQQIPVRWSNPGDVALPDNPEEIVFYPIEKLARLIRQRRVTSMQLTRLYLARLKKFGPELKCVVSLTEKLALKQAAQADREIASGNYRGLLHGIPYGAKDLLTVKGYKTTWGAMPYKDQVIDQTAAVIGKLEKAGAVLVAKLTLGALAWGDVWYGGKTLNPWNLKQGSSGSSAGPAAATSAGLVAFAIGSETWGSIVSPSTRCGVTGLRPTFGRVSRTGAMALSWSMDKIGPICRTVEDAAIVLDAIRGSDGVDQTVIEAPFNYQPQIDLSKLRVGFLQKEFHKDTLLKTQNDFALAKLKELGADLIPVALPDLPVYSMSFILNAEAATAFDDLTRSGRDSLMVRQIRNAWPNVFRASRFIPAVEYIQANRIRYLLVQQMQKIFDKVDVYVSPSFGKNLLMTNLTGHPCVVLPNGFDENGNPVSISFVGRLFDEATLLAVSKKYQDATGFHKKHPPLFSVK